MSATHIQAQRAGKHGSIPYELRDRLGLWFSRRATILFLVLAVLGAGWWKRQDFQRLAAHVRLLRIQTTCLNYEPPQGSVAYDNSVVRPRFISAKGGDEPLPVMPANSTLGRPEWVAWLGAVSRGYSPFDVLNLFALHGLTNKNGQRLVAVMLNDVQDGSASTIGYLSFRALVYEPATVFHAPKLLTEERIVALLPHDGVRLVAVARTVPDTSSVLVSTIRHAQGEDRIELRLKDDDRVDIAFVQP